MKILPLLGASGVVDSGKAGQLNPAFGVKNSGRGGEFALGRSVDSFPPTDHAFWVNTSTPTINSFFLCAIKLN